MKNKPNKDMLDAMHRNPGNWKGVFYFNRKDPRLTVPKINGLGWTFNFSNPLTYLLIVVVAALIIAEPYLFN